MADRRQAVAQGVSSARSSLPVLHGRHRTTPLLRPALLALWLSALPIGLGVRAFSRFRGGTAFWPFSLRSWASGRPAAFGRLSTRLKQQRPLRPLTRVRRRYASVATHYPAATPPSASATAICATTGEWSAGDCGYDVMPTVRRDELGMAPGATSGTRPGCCASWFVSRAAIRRPTRTRPTLACCRSTAPTRGATCSSAGSTSPSERSSSPAEEIRPGPVPPTSACVPT